MVALFNFTENRKSRRDTNCTKQSEFKSSRCMSPNILSQKSNATGNQRLHKKEPFNWHVLQTAHVRMISVSTSSAQSSGVAFHRKPNLFIKLIAQHC